MPEYTVLDGKTYPRLEHFTHFCGSAGCMISLADDIDVTLLKHSCRENNRSFYITFLYIISYIVNSRDEFRMTAVSAENSVLPAVWDSVNAGHNVFHEDTETFTSTFTVWNRDYNIFYRNCTDDIEKAHALSTMSVPSPSNTFEASCVPWRHFTSVGIVRENTCCTELLPTIVWGGFRESNGKTYMPLSIEISHAAADGFHLARFLNEAEALAGSMAKRIDR